MEEDDKNQPVILPKRLADSLNDLLGKKSESTSFVQGLFDAVRPLINDGREREKRQVKSKLHYQKKINMELEQFKTTAEKLMAVQNEITKIDTIISEEKIRHYTGNVNYYVSIREILIPIKNNLKEKIEIEKFLSSVSQPKLTIEKKVRAKRVKKTKLYIDPAILKKVIDHLIGKNKFLEEDRLSLTKAFYCEDVSAKITWFGNANVWLTILYDLQKNNLIKSDKTILTEWVIKYFNYKPKTEVKAFKSKSVYETFNESKKKRRVHHKSPKYIDAVKILESTSTK